MATPNGLVFYGFPDECRRFDERHPLWQEMMNNLITAIDLAFKRVAVMQSAVDKLVYFFGRVVVEDFMEIVLVCSHGYGVAACKLVRSMYEFAVTLRYLHEHPEEAETFLAYHLVQQDKLTSRVIETFGQTILPAELVSEIRRKAAEVKNDFMVPVCDHPDSKMRLNHSWNKLDFVSMAKQTGAIGRLIVPGYYFPLRHAHPTFGGLTERLEILNETMSLKADAQPDIADRSLMTAHNCILDATKVQSEHFKIAGLEDAIQVSYRDFVRIWSPDSPLLKD
jgi:hypothetical protein